MKKGFFAILALVLTGFGLQAQSLAEKVLFTVEGDTVTAEEYMAVYNKNRDIGQEIDPKTPAEYLELYINFKLKVHGLWGYNSIQSTKVPCLTPIHYS